MSNCPKCGFPIAPDESACSNCGEPVENVQIENITPENIEPPVENISEEIVDIPEQVPEELGIADMVAEETNVASISSAEIAQDVSVAPQASEMPMIAPSTVETPVVAAEQEIPVAPQAPEMPMMAPSTVETPVVAVEQEIPVAPQAPEMPIMAPSTVEMPTITIEQEMPVAPQMPETLAMPQSPVEMQQSMMASMPPEMLPVTPDVPMAPMPTVSTPEMNTYQEMPMISNVVEAPSIEGSTIPTEEPIKKEKSSTLNIVMFVVVFLVSVAAIGLLAFFMLKMFSSNNIVQGNKTPDKAKEYHYEGFNLYLEEKDKDKNDIHAEIYEGEFYVGSSTWSAVMTLQTGTYNTLVSNKSQLVDYFKNMGYEATEPAEKEISGTAFVKMEVVMGGKNVLVAYAKANGTKIFGIVLENETGVYDDDDLKTIGTIISTAKYVGPEYTLPEGFQLDLFKETFMVAE